MEEKSKEIKPKKITPPDQQTVVVSTKNKQVLSYLEKKATSNEFKLIKAEGLCEQLENTPVENISKIKDTIKKYLENEENIKEARRKAVQLSEILSKTIPNVYSMGEIEFKEVTQRTNLSYKDVKSLVEIFTVHGLAVPVNNHCFQFTLKEIDSLPYLESKIDSILDELTSLRYRFRRIVSGSLLKDDEKEAEKQRIDNYMKNVLFEE